MTATQGDAVDGQWIILEQWARTQAERRLREHEAPRQRIAGNRCRDLGTKDRRRHQEQRRAYGLAHHLGDRRRQGRRRRTDLAATAVSKEELQGRLITCLRAEQQQAQVRVSSAKQEGLSPSAADRDVAGWLATGLCDLFADRITGKQFLNDGVGIIARHLCLRKR